MEFRRATLADSDLLLAWRNDPLTRRMSINTDAVSPRSHRAWFEAALADPARDIVVALEHHGAAGRIDVRREGGEATIGWTVAPERRGLGVGRQMVAAFVNRHPANYRAEIKKDNKASLKIAENANISYVVLPPSEVLCQTIKDSSGLETLARPTAPETTANP